MIFNIIKFMMNIFNFEVLPCSPISPPHLSFRYNFILVFLILNKSLCCMLHVLLAMFYEINLGQIIVSLIFFHL